MKTALRVIIVLIVIVGLVASYTFSGFTSSYDAEPYVEGPVGPPPS